MLKMLSLFFIFFSLCKYKKSTWTRNK